MASVLAGKNTVLDDVIVQHTNVLEYSLVLHISSSVVVMFNCTHNVAFFIIYVYVCFIRE